MQINIEEEIRQFLQGMKSLTNLKDFAQGACCGQGCCDEEDEDEETECPIMVSMEKDYKDFMKWAFGCEEGEEGIIKAKRRWKKLHPDLPIPRVMLTDERLGSGMGTVCLFMDAYPLYLASQKR